MTLADHLGFLAEADSPLGRLRTEPELPGSEKSTGEVFPATDIETDRRFALKLVRGRAAMHPEVVEAAHADAVAQTPLEHPRIATLHESGPMPAGFYLLMQWLDGRSLAQVLRDGPMDPWTALTVAFDVADAVETAAGAGIVHRDLTPAKVIVGQDGHAALGDLGAGRRRPGEAPSPSSLDYLSPEQVRDEPVTGASHEYALGCILFHCLTGTAPFARARASAKTFWHVRAPRPLVSEHRGGLPDGLDEVVARAMAIVPGDRHGSPLALVEAAGAVLGRPPADGEERSRFAPAPPQRDRGRAPRPAPPGAPAPERPFGPERRPWAPAGAVPATDAGSDAPEGTLDWVQDAPGPSRLTWVLGGVAAAALLGAALLGGTLAGKETKDPPAAVTAGAVGTDKVAIVRPAGWKVLDPTPEVPGVQATEQIAVGPREGAGTAVVAGVAEPGSDGLLPQGLLDEQPEDPGRGDPVRLGELEGFRFRDLQAGGAPMTVYAVPTSEGTAMVACLGATSTAARARCDEQAASLQLTGPDPLPVRPAPKYAQALEDAFAALRRTREAQLSSLSGARTRTQQSAAARKLATAYGDAASALRGAPDRRFVEAENGAIVQALEAAAAAYGSLAYNAGRGDAAGYGVARARSVSAEGAVRRGLKRLEDAGYRIG